MFKPLSKTQIRQLNRKSRLTYSIDKFKLILVLQDVENPFNVGSIFRTSSALGVDKIYLLGKTPYPPNDKISINSMGFERSVKWSYFADIFQSLYELKNQGLRLVGLDLCKNSVDINDFNFDCDIALVLGNEVRGIYKKYLSIMDHLVHIPMFGSGPSLNVSIACGIALGIRISKLKSL